MNKQFEKRKKDKQNKQKKQYREYFFKRGRKQKRYKKPRSIL